MSSSAELLVDLAGVARLAGVQRPTASMWRSRFGAADDPFPARVTEKSGRAFFDALEVARWLERTGHGNNRSVVVDAASAAVPDGFDIANRAHVDTIDAVLTIRAGDGSPAAGTPADATLAERARAIDPSDRFLGAEVATVPPAWASWADLLADAAYSPLGASRLIEQRHLAHTRTEGAAGALTPIAAALVASLTRALSTEFDAVLSPAAGVTPELMSAIRASSGGDVSLAQTPPLTARRLRRRLFLEGSPTHDEDEQAARVVVSRHPASDAVSPRQILHAIDEIALSMSDTDRALVIAPARVLTDALDAHSTLARADIVRSGRVRAVVKLPTSLVVSAPREALAVWVLGREHGGVPIGERFTAVADLSDVALSTAAVGDLVSDVTAALGSARDVRAHAFRFTRLMRTSSLLARRGSLTEGVAPVRAGTPRSRDLPALVDAARSALGDVAPAGIPHAQTSSPAAAARLDALLAAGHVRMLPGTRLDAEEYVATGLEVIHADDLDTPQAIGARHVDALSFASAHPSARLTAPGDVVFRVGSSPRAWVDSEGSRVVAYPARVLRIRASDPGGLVPDVVAADISRSVGGPGSWRRWQLRRVAPAEAEGLARALADAAAVRADLTRRIAALDAYTELLTEGVVAGVVTLSENAADAASEPL